MSKRTDGRVRANWLAIRTYYLEGHTVEECAQRFKVSTRQIERRRSNEGWVGERREHVGEARHVVTEAVKADLVKIQLDHIEYADKLLQIVLDGESDLAAMIPGRSRIEARRAFIESAERALKCARIVRGLTDGDASTEDTDADAAIEVVQRRLDPVKIPTNERGRAIVSEVS